jgi:signal transduction histidine kinase/CHASE2 domain-containing sensor protein
MSASSAGDRRPSLVTSWLALNVLLLAVVALLSLTYPVEELSRRLEDEYFRLRAQEPTSSSAALILIDDASLQRYGRWPWPRAQLARLLRAVSLQRPAAIGLDFLLAEPGDEAGDAELSKAIHEAGQVVLAAKLGASPDHAWINPIPLFRRYAAAIGHVEAETDSDGIGRRVPLIELTTEGPRWPLALEMARVARGQQFELEGNTLWLGHARIPVEGRPSKRTNQGWSSYSPQFLIINYRPQLIAGQPEPSFLAIYPADIIDGHTKPALQGMAVLIGFGASDLSDRIATPVSGQMPMPGVEVHANLLDGLLTGRGLRHARLGSKILLLVAFSMLSTGLVLRRPGWKFAWIPIILFVACFAGGFWLFRHWGILLELGPLLCAAVLAVPLAQLENLAIVNRALTRGLQQLRGTLFAGSTAGQLPSFQPDSRLQDSADLPEKLDLVQNLQSELAASYTFRQNLLESMHEALAVFDATGKSEFCNPNWERFCAKQNWNSSITLEELGRFLGHPAWSNLPERMRQGDLPPESEVYLGGGFWQVRGMRLSPDHAGGPRWMVVITDLTSRLERDQARAEALRFVTHELRTPLVSIQGFSEFLLRYPNAAGSTEAAATIFRESQRLVSLINTYLDVLRFDAGARSLRKEEIDIAEMVEQVEKIMAPIADSAEIDICVALAPALPKLFGDPPMLTGVLLNLLNNAVKYSAPGSKVSLHVCHEHSSALFEVSNPGAPIPSEQLSRLFEPFYRAQEQETSAPGWGLGLTFVKRIVEEHQGTIEATSGQSGIKVRVTIPIQSAHTGS